MQLFCMGDIMGPWRYVVFRGPILRRLVLGQAQKPPDTKAVNHDGGTWAPGQFAYFHLHPAFG